jgi:hypothetical protein
LELVGLLSNRNLWYIALHYSLQAYTNKLWLPPTPLSGYDNWQGTGEFDARRTSRADVTSAASEASRTGKQEEEGTC